MCLKNSLGFEISLCVCVSRSSLFIHYHVTILLSSEVKQIPNKICLQLVRPVCYIHKSSMQCNCMYLKVYAVICYLGHL
jgi:hypothetical protein